MHEAQDTSAQQIVSQLAARRAVHRAFQWFHLQEPRLREWHRQVAAIPAPMFGELARAKWLQKQFTALGLDNVEIDPCGNVLGWLRGSSNASNHEKPSSRIPCTLCSAHLDTVFPAEAITQPLQDDNRLLGPSVSDNCAGITALLANAAAMRSTEIVPASDILFVGNVGEEGEGNLRGMRYLFTESPFASRIRSAVVLDGAGTESIVTQGLGSKRFRIAISGPGGHSWTDAGVPNPILVLADALAEIGRGPLPSDPRTTWNIGTIGGGTAINVIPQTVEARIDTRSVDANELCALESRIVGAVRNAVFEANKQYSAPVGGSSASPLQFTIESLGERPAAKLSEGAGVLTVLRSVDRHLGIRSGERIASTDANIPLSLGTEAVSIGGGGSGGGVHTLQEWFDATGRDLALRRILLLLLALTQVKIEP